MSAAVAIETFYASRPCVKCGREGTTDKHDPGITAEQAAANAKEWSKYLAERDAEKAKYESDLRRWKAASCWSRGAEPRDPQLYYRRMCWAGSTRPVPPSIWRTCKSCGFVWSERPLDYPANAHLYEVPKEPK